MAINWHNLTIYHVGLPLKTAFQTAQSTTTVRQLFILSADITLNGVNVKGLGEVQSFETPFYTDEILTDDLVALQQLWPTLRDQTFADLNALVAWLQVKLPNQPFLRAGLEMIVWDARTKVTHQTLSELIGGSNQPVPMGIALGVSANLATEVENAYTQGYRRIKLKTPPNTDFKALAPVIREFSDVQFSFDANMSWTELSAQQLREINLLGVRLVEQPFGKNDWLKHQKLQQNWSNTAVSLDESLQNFADIQRALTQNSADAFTIKQGMLGGLSTAMKAIELIQDAGKLAWIGGMLSSNIGRAFDISLASLPAVRDFPGDISDSARYFEHDVTTRAFVGEHGLMAVPDFELRLTDDVLLKYGIQTIYFD
ncbi:MAG TPA: o-succinylbenzoate synthase [Lactobacillaceae bacterium]|jgi:O-succinylbenzoate synthase